MLKTYNDYTARAIQMLMDKNADYGNSAFTCAKYAPVKELVNPNDVYLQDVITPDSAILVRLGDKIARAFNLTDPEKKRASHNEPIVDTLWDIVGYTALLTAYYRNIKDTDTRGEWDPTREQLHKTLYEIFSQCEEKLNPFDDMYELICQADYDLKKGRYVTVLNNVLNFLYSEGYWLEN